MTNEELVYLYQQGDKKALQSLIEKNKGIINKLVNKFYVERTNSIDREDLEQEGVIGLITAANKYDFNNEKKAQFITYAVHWIYSMISRYIRQKNTNDETSINIPIGDDGDNELIDLIKSEDYSYENIEEKIYRQQLRQELDQVMNKYLTLKQREVLILHYGLDAKPWTYDAIGELMGVSGSRIRDIERYSLRQLARTTWGVNKAKEFYINKIKSSHYRIDEAINIMNFADKYLSI